MLNIHHAIKTAESLSSSTTGKHLSPGHNAPGFATITSIFSL
jgi:hypothetical protein